MSQPTIFISIAAIDDTEVVPTVVNALEAATYPDRVHIGVGIAALSDKNYVRLNELFKDNPRVRTSFKPIIKGDFSELGIGHGRMRAHALYKEEDYFLQVDCHTYFDKGWDETLIQLYSEAKAEANSDRVIMTAYLGRYGYVPTRKPIEGRTKLCYAAFQIGRFFFDVIPGWNDEPLTDEYPNKFYPSVKFNSHFAFGDSIFGRSFSISPGTMFYEDDFTCSTLLYGMGFSFVYPNVDPFPCYHLYVSEINKLGGERTPLDSYIEDDGIEALSKLSCENYLGFLNNPENAEALAAYEKYAVMSGEYGPIIPNYVPTKYRI